MTMTSTSFMIRSFAKCRCFAAPAKYVDHGGEQLVRVMAISARARLHTVRIVSHHPFEPPARQLK
jgi:hypothetical protein